MAYSDGYVVQLLVNIPIHLHQYVAPIFYVIGNLGNCLIFYIFLKRSWRKNVCVLYFLVCLVSNSIFINAPLLGTIFTTGFQIDLTDSNEFLCKVFYYVAFLTSIYYPVTLILASIDRLLISSKNVSVRLYSSKRLAYLNISINTVLCIGFSLHLFIKVHIQEIRSTVFKCYYDQSSSYMNFFIYSTLLISILLPLIMIILSVLAFKNVRRIQAVARQRRQVIRSMNKKDFQLLRCLYVHNIIYIICSTLVVFAIGYSLRLNYETSTAVELAIQNFLIGSGTFIHYLPYISNIFVFICVSKAFRMEVKRVILKIYRRDLNTMRDTEENNQPEVIRNNIGLNTIISTIHLNTHREF
ncbi:unnamed protein product [Adineta ricciae]|uniref:G-protein coupled receptors family 1 profile domain-containing protein n=1 Tax=Adineta ricciae TaxID=249248 RepID=A0A815R4B0_ADIRI|nr:unnamed protein product [Adineta ricciae]